MGNILMGILIVLVIIYIISPIDFVPGPIDDILAALLTLAAAKKKFGGIKKIGNSEVKEVDNNKED